MAEETKKTETKPEAAESSFTKKQIVNSRKYRKWVDFFNAQLSDKKEYTHTELKAMLKKTFKIDI